MALPSTYVVRVYAAAWRGRRAVVGIVEDGAGAARSFHDAQELWALITAVRLLRTGKHQNRILRRKR
jgi:hypothetical protein